MMRCLVLTWQDWLADFPAEVTAIGGGRWEVESGRWSYHTKARTERRPLAGEATRQGTSRVGPMKVGVSAAMLCDGVPVPCLPQPTSHHPCGQAAAAYSPPAVCTADGLNLPPAPGGRGGAAPGQSSWGVTVAQEAWDGGSLYSAAGVGGAALRTWACRLLDSVARSWPGVCGCNATYAGSSSVPCSHTPPSCPRAHMCSHGARP
jgi:hypothetical protein